MSTKSTSDNKIQFSTYCAAILEITNMSLKLLYAFMKQIKPAYCKEIAPIHEMLKHTIFLFKYFLKAGLRIYDKDWEVCCFFSLSKAIYFYKCHSRVGALSGSGLFIVCLKTCLRLWLEMGYNAESFWI